jgi:hypothetical protein
MSYQCHNRAPFAESVQAQNGWTLDGRRQLESVALKASRNCEYTLSALGKADKECVGCERKKEAA